MSTQVNYMNIRAQQIMIKLKANNPRNKTSVCQPCLTSLPKKLVKTSPATLFASALTAVFLYLAENAFVENAKQFQV